MAHKLTDDQKAQLAEYAEQITHGNWQNNTEFIRFYNEVSGEREEFQGFNIGVDSRLKKSLLALASKHKVAPEETVEEVVDTESRTVVLDEAQPEDKPAKAAAKKK